MCISFNFSLLFVLFPMWSETPSGVKMINLPEPAPLDRRVFVRTRGKILTRSLGNSNNFFCWTRALEWKMQRVRELKFDSFNAKSRKVLLWRKMWNTGSWYSESIEMYSWWIHSLLSIVISLIFENFIVTGYTLYLCGFNSFATELFLLSSPLTPRASFSLNR